MYTKNFQIVEREQTSVKEEKKELRSFMKRRRAETENRDIKERALVENFLKFLSEKGFQIGKELTCFIYLSYSSEAPTLSLIDELKARGVRVLCPRVDGEYMQAVPFGKDFTLSDKGILEPTGEAFCGKIDIAVVPLLAVDKFGKRLGYGGGYYDRFLTAHKETLAVGYCYDFQIVESVPCEEHDIPLDGVVSDKRKWTTKEK